MSKLAIYHKAFRFTESDINMLDEWKDALGAISYIEVIRIALRRMSGDSRAGNKDVPRHATQRIRPGENGDEVIEL